MRETEKGRGEMGECTDGHEAVELGGLNHLAEAEDFLGDGTLASLA